MVYRGPTKIGSTSIVYPQLSQLLHFNHQRYTLADLLPSCVVNDYEEPVWKLTPETCFRAPLEGSNARVSRCQRGDALRGRLRRCASGSEEDVQYLPPLRSHSLQVWVLCSAALPPLPRQAFDYRLARLPEILPNEL